jgi:sugar phosphate isomerase/epimerase
MARFILSSFADESASDLQSQLRISAKNDIKFIEMRNVNGLSLVDLEIAEVKKIKAEMDAQGFRLSAIGSPFGKIVITEDFAPHLEKFKRCVEIAHVMETRFIRMFSFFIPQGEDPAAYHDEVMERLEKFVEAVEGSGISCCHENEKGIFGNSPERCLDILKTFGGKIKGIFDPANFIQEGFRPLPAFELLSPYIEYMHMKDALLADGSVTPSGKGDGDIAELLTRFSKTTGDRYLTVEPHLAVFDGFAKLENSDVSIKNHGYVYQSNEEAYETAVNALKTILSEIGCSQQTVGGFTQWTK